MVIVETVVSNVVGIYWVVTMVTCTLLDADAVTVDVGVTWLYDVAVTMTVCWGKVVVFPVTPAQLQADEYRTVPEQADAYEGTLLGERVIAGQVLTPEDEEPAGGAVGARF